jgi:hypothetical protein
MMQISHAATGAAVGKFAPNPLIAFLLGILIHFVIDKIPHWWPVSKDLQGKLLVADYALAILFIVTLYLTHHLTVNIAWGIAGSLIVDILLVGIKPILVSKAGVWHETRQPHLEQAYTFWTDIAVIFVSTAIIYLVK